MHLRRREHKYLCGGRQWEKAMQVMGICDGGCLGPTATGCAINEGDTPQSAQSRCDESVGV
jgi:hypothetical protein